jgi:uncharacterized protein
MKMKNILIIFLAVTAINTISLAQPTSSPLIQGKNELMVPMADGVKLATDVYLPKKQGKLPVILVRTPYNKSSEEWMKKAFRNLGIAAVVQDCRGKFKSEGEFYPFINEREDGLQTLRWIRKQPWADGRVAGWGGSYVGFTQWAISDSLSFLTPLLTDANLYDLFYPDSLFSLHLAFLWGFLNASQTMNQIPMEKIAASMLMLPLSAADDSTIKEIPFITDILQHQNYDSWWKKYDYRGITRSPFVSAAGWYDIFLKGQIADFEALSASNSNARMVIGPWCHGNPGEKNEYGGKKKTGTTSMLLNVEKDFLAGKEIRLKKPFKDQKYNLFIMEKNEYVGSDVWPPRQTKIVPFYIGAESYLGPQPANGQGKFEYTYDPAAPLQNIGGTILGSDVGPARQNPNSERKDQVIVQTGILDKPLTLLGPISATLYLSSSAECTDFIIGLQDLFPDGKIINIQEGGASVRFNGMGPEKKEISVWATGYQVKPGHRLRVMITSSWFPRYNRNLNSCEPLISAGKIVKASQSIWFGPETPSSVNLPVFVDN